MLFQSDDQQDDTNRDNPAGARYSGTDCVSALHQIDRLGCVSSGRGITVLSLPF